jgi:hypothetical protein
MLRTAPAREPRPAATARVGRRVVANSDATNFDSTSQGGRSVRTSHLAFKHEEGYWFLSTRPLHVLAFLLPLLCLYELGTLFFLSGHGVVEVVRARVILAQVFDLFGQAGFHLPPILLGVVLLVWHSFTRDPFRVKVNTLTSMAAESLVWGIVLVACMMIVGRATMMASITGDVAPQALSIPARITLSLGAGLYEETVFRLVIITLLYAVMVDILKQNEFSGKVMAGAASALAFALYHDVRMPAGGIDVGLFITYFGAGCFFATLFVRRGFGIAVATHAVYDVIVLLFLAR